MGCAYASVYDYEWLTLSFGGTISYPGYSLYFPHIYLIPRDGLSYADLSSRY